MLHLFQINETCHICKVAFQGGCKANAACVRERDFIPSRMQMTQSCTVHRALSLCASSLGHRFPVQLEPRINECDRNWNVLLNIQYLSVCACAESLAGGFRKCASCLQQQQMCSRWRKIKDI